MKEKRVGDVGLNGRTLRYKRQVWDVAGGTAHVETDGDVVARFTATRLVFLGVFALAFKKKKDQRGLYLMAEGPGWAFVAELDPKKDAVKAREMAQAITLAGSTYPPLGAEVVPAAAAVAEPVVAVAASAGWHPDPRGIARLRYWDGAVWTEHVAE